jgi:hypothetical protein
VKWSGRQLLNPLISKRQRLRLLKRDIYKKRHFRACTTSPVSSRIRDFNSSLILSYVRGAHDLAGSRFSGTWSVGFQVLPVGLASPQSAARSGDCGSSPIQFWDEKGHDAMSETQQFKNFRIWAALGTALLYVFLTATGNA